MCDVDLVHNDQKVFFFYAFYSASQTLRLLGEQLHNV